MRINSATALFEVLTASHATALVRRIEEDTMAYDEDLAQRVREHLSDERA